MAVSYVHAARCIDARLTHYGVSFSVCQNQTLDIVPSSAYLFAQGKHDRQNRVLHDMILRLLVCNKLI